MFSSIQFSSVQNQVVWRVAILQALGVRGRGGVEEVDGDRSRGKECDQTLIILSPPRGRHQALITQSSPRNHHHQAISRFYHLKVV